jgi:hypothetical protein
MKPPPHSFALTPIVIVFMAVVAFLMVLNLAIVPLKTANDSNVVACTDEAKICPDGSAVGRTGPRCEFAECPTTNTNRTGSDGCIITGCSGQVCSDQEQITTCEYRAEYTCYQSASCERQADGRCGWTTTNDLQKCLTEAQADLPTGR